MPPEAPQTTRIGEDGEVAELERVTECPLCGARELSPLDVRNLNSRDAKRIAEVKALLGSDFFVRQSLGICEECDHVFQIQRPTSAALSGLYGAFAETLGKVTASEKNMVEYLLRHNSKDYVAQTSRSIDFLDQHSLLDGVESVLELRTYGGTLLAVLKERGCAHCEGAYLDEFDAAMARRMFAIEQLHPFSFATGIQDVVPELDAYDLIIAYEGLTHSQDPVEVIEWLSDHLLPGGCAVLFREPNTPNYRRYFPLEIVFNNFHLHLFSEGTLSFALERGGFSSFDLFDDYHPMFPIPLYLTGVLQKEDSDTSVRQRPAPRRYERKYYESWIRRDRSRVLTFGERALGKSTRMTKAALRRLGARS
jgi:hypothetical protein